MEGANGAARKDGANGATGTNGANGSDGSDGSDGCCVIRIIFLLLQTNDKIRKY